MIDYTADGPPKGGRHIHLHISRDAIRPEYPEDGSATPMGKFVSGSRPAKGTLITRLDGEITSYYIDVGPDGFGAALYQTPVTDDLGEEGRMAGGASPAALAIRDPDAYPQTARMTDAVARDKVRQSQTRTMGQQVRDFWSKQSNAA